VTLAPGTRVRLVAPSGLLELSDTRGTVVGPAEWDGYVLVRLDEPARCRCVVCGRDELGTVREAEDNLEVVGS
jgi:hypothetical protein